MDDVMRRRAIASIRGLAQGQHLGPALALVLGLGSMIEAFVYASPNDRPTAMVANLAVALPLAVAFRWRLWTAAATPVLMMIPLSGAVVLTASAVVAQLIVLFLVGGGFGPVVSSAFAVPYLLNALFNWSGGDPDASGLLPLVLVAGGPLPRLRPRGAASGPARPPRALEPTQGHGDRSQPARPVPRLPDAPYLGRRRVAHEDDQGAGRKINTEFVGWYWCI